MIGRKNRSFPRCVPRCFLAAAALLLAATGCATQATFDFACDPGQEINGGLLLTVDVVVIDEREEQEIRQLGDQWFYSDLRRTVGGRKETVGLKAGCRETVVVPQVKGYDRLAVIADYQFEGRTGGKTQMEFFGKKEWRGKRLRARIADRYLTITRG